MPKKIPTAELEALVTAAAESADGLPIAELQEVLPDLPRRTLQHRLARLVGEGRLVQTGKGRAARYRVPVRRAETAVETDSRGRTPALPGFSPEALEIRELVERPIAERRPVGYKSEFLEGYRPNRTRYLPADLRDRLHDLGRSPVGERPAGTYARQVLDRLLIDLSWASSRLEGNTYSRLDTQNLIAFGRAAESKDRLEAQMILNHKRAIEMLVEDAEVIGLDRLTFQNLHALLAENLLPDPGRRAACGRWTS